MKELSVEEKAKAYDKVREKIAIRFGSNVADEIFSQFEMSEDERTWIINYLTNEELNSSIIEEKKNLKKALAWLEKQGEKPIIEMKSPEESLGIDSDTYNKIVDECIYDEQKPADKVEPKFHVNEWVVTDKNDVVQIKAVYNGYYTIDNGMGFYMPYVDRYWHKWTINDAKDGDVLYECNEKNTFIFKELETKHIGDIASYCDIFNGIFNPNEDDWTTLDIVPATKEQRDQLEKAMADVGYTFDFEKKELKKIEQKPDTQHSTEWSVSDFRTWQYIVSDVLTKKDGIGQYLDSGECKKIAKYMQEEWGGKLSKEQTQEELRKGEDYGIDGLYHAISILEKTLGKVDGYQSDDGILEHKIAIDTLKAIQNPAWSEEDETTKNNISHIIRQYDKISKKEKQPCWYVGDCLLWMQNIKDRVQPQPKQEWSEEDEKMVGNIRSIIEKYAFSQSAVDVNGDLCEKEYIEADNWLKSLRPQNTWKPSDEQIKVCKEVYADILSAKGFNLGTVNSELNRLEEELKKLK